MPAPTPLDPTPPRVPLVLVVDDDADMRAYLADCLAPLAVRLLEATNGEDALARLGRDDDAGLALVVTDLLMPGMGGRALKAALLRDRRWSAVPVLLVTGEAVRARDGPALRKPFNARQLRAAARALLPPS